MKKLEYIPSCPLPRSTPEAEGVPSRAIARVIERFAEEGLETHSMMSARNGKVIADCRWEPYIPDYPYTLFSLTKSYNATAVALAIDAGLMSLDSKVVSFFPECDKLDLDEKMREMTVRHCLTMTSGYYENISGSGVWSQMNENWVETFLQLPLSYTPGSHYVYNSGSSHIMSAIISRATGQSSRDYLMDRLFLPMGIEDVRWDTDHQGNSCGGWGLNLCAEDTIKFAQLYLQEGVWNGKRLLPEWWVRQCGQNYEKPYANDDGIGYGYQFWNLADGTYFGAGAFGQYVVIMPYCGVVASIMAAKDTHDSGRVKQTSVRILAEELSAGVNNGIPATEGADFAELKSVISKLSLYRPKTAARAGTESRINSKKYICEGIFSNVDRIEAMQFDFLSDRLDYRQWDSAGEHIVSCGIGEWLEGTTTITGKALHHNREFPVMSVAGCAEWTDDKTLVMRWAFLNMPFVDTVKCTFDGDKVIMIRSSNVNSENVVGGMTKRPAVRGHMQKLR